MTSKLQRVSSELRRRHVYRVGASYVVVGLGVLGAAELILDPLGLGAARPTIVVLTLLGFPLAVLVAWAHGAKTSAPARHERIDSSRRGSERSYQSVAVLPFQNLADQRESDFFSEGITEELIGHLSRIRALKVISRTSVMALRNSELGAKEIGEKLDVAVLVEGSVRRSEESLWITAKLVDTETEHAFWTQTFDRPLGGLFELQNELSSLIAHQLNAAVTEAEMDRLHRKPSASLEAYDLYLLGWYHWYRWTQVGWTKGVEYLERAIAAAPEFAAAHAATAEAYTPLAAFDVVPRTQAWEKVREHALRALALDEESAVALAALGMEQSFHQWDRPAAERSFRRAVAFDPSSAICHECYGVTLMSFGDFAEAETELSFACDLDPLHPVMRSNVGHLCLMRGENDEALRHMELAVSLEPRSPIPHLGVGEALLQLDDPERAILAFEHSVDLAPLRWGLMDLGYAYARVGRASEAGAQIDRLENSVGDPASYEIALILAALGRLEESYAWFDKACTERSYLLAQHGLWDPRVMQLLGNDKVIELRSRMSRTPPFLLSK